MARRLRPWRIARDWLIVLTGLSALGLAWYASRPARPAASRPLTITAGSLQGERTRIAEALRDEAARRGLVLRIVETAGSEEALERLADPAGGLDLAMVQGGLALDPARSPAIREVAALHDEPLHLLIRGEALTAEVRDRGLPALRGRRINLSTPGSGTHRLAMEVLDFAGLPPGSYEATEYGYDDLLTLEDRADADDDPAAPPRPDAVFMVSTLPARVAEVLVERHGYGLAPVPYARAFARWRPDEGRPAVVHRHVREAEIPALTYDREPPIPPEPVPTLATRMLLVARADLEPERVEEVLQVVFESPFAHADQPPLDAAVLRGNPEVPWHHGAESYVRRRSPVIAEDLIDLAEKEVSIGAAVLGGLFCLWQWLRQRLRRLRDRSFQTYIVKVADVERRAMAVESGASLDLPALLDLQRELAALKAEALEGFAAGELDGEELMVGFLAQVNDARDHLTRLILHERDNLEDRAARQGRSAEALWTEAVPPPA